VVLVGYGPAAPAALVAASDPSKVAGVVLLGVPGAMKAPEKYKSASLIVTPEESQETAAKIYSDLKKPRYLYSVAGLDKAFMPPEKADPVFTIIWAWLSYRYFDRDDLKSMVSGADAQELLNKGTLKLFKVEE
jgi:hypothetical protein